MVPNWRWCLGVSVLLIAGALVAWWFTTPVQPRAASPESETIGMTFDSTPVIYALPPSPAHSFLHPEAARRALQFLDKMQPTGTYVQSILGQPQVVPMDVAHVAIAMSEADQLSRAEAAMTWLYERMILSGQPGSTSQKYGDFSGSWFDSIQPNGSPMPGATRGRGEAVGMALIATYTIYEQDPSYLQTLVGDSRVIDLVSQAIDFLTRPNMQASDGRFYHSPDYHVAFNEENARMSLGLELAGRMLAASGENGAARLALIGASRGLAALRSGDGMDQGMAYDYYGGAIWGLVTPTRAQAEIKRLQSTGLVSADGVRNWDWQLDRTTSLFDWFHWWLQAQMISPSQTFDYAIACITAHDVTTALDLEQRWLPLQRSDGGFDDSYLFGLRLGMGAPTSYSAARFILLDHLLSSLIDSSSRSGPV
ncbi:MAG TPA: hypothetical protein VKX96_13025 [Chloroflexota bacterium]|nr:hypothetical protein [Chloroflexota bacterium]